MGESEDSDQYSIAWIYIVFCTDGSIFASIVSTTVSRVQRLEFAIIYLKTSSTIKFWIHLP